MNTKYLVGLLGASAAFTALFVAALILFVSHSHFRQTVGHDKPSFDKFAARVESGGFKPETMMSFTNSWFLAQKQDHQVIQTEEIVSDRQAERLLVLGVLGLLVVLFQTWLIFSLRSDLRKP
jgi:hypothetical protein